MKNDKILLCKKCLDNGDYFMLLYQKNEVTNDIEFACSKSHNLENEDIFSSDISEDLIKKLSKCKIHDEEEKNHAFSAWCDKCKQNLCFYEVGEHLNKKEKYILYMDIMPNFDFIELKDRINDLRCLLNSFNDNEPELKKEINYLNQIIPLFTIILKLYKMEVINFQVIKNLSFIINNIPTIQDIKKSIILSRFGYLIEGITKNALKDINIKYLNMEVNEDSKIIPLIDENNINKYIAIFPIKEFSYEIKHCMQIYNLNGNNINKVKEVHLEEFEEGKKFLITNYNEKILVVCQLPMIYFIIFNNDYEDVKLHSIKIQNHFSFDKFEDLIAINSNKILLLIEGIAYVYTFDDTLNSCIKSEKIDDYDKNTFYRAKLIYYKKDKQILKGYATISLSYPSIKQLRSERIFDFDYDENLNIKFKKFEELLIVTIFDSELKIIDEYELNYRQNYSSSKIDMSYNYLNDMILVVIDEKIFQLSIKTKEVITIYDISYNTSGLSKDINEEEYKIGNKTILSLNKKCGYSNIQNIKFITFYNYDSLNECYEEVVLLMKKNKDKIYQFYWDEKTLILKKEYNYNKIYDFIPLYNPFDFKLKNKKLQKILFETFGGLLFE